MNIRYTVEDDQSKTSSHLIEGIKNTYANDDIQGMVKCITNNSTLTLVKIEKGGEYTDIGLGD